MNILDLFNLINLAFIITPQILGTNEITTSFNKKNTRLIEILIQY